MEKKIVLKFWIIFFLQKLTMSEKIEIAEKVKKTPDKKKK